MGAKGLAVINEIVNRGFSTMVEKVVIAHDSHMENDYYEDIQSACSSAKISVCDRKDLGEVSSDYCFAISWRWLIELRESTKLIVLHDSLLPKYRGFSPLVNMLINKEPYIGVSALFACEKYDIGDIITQRKSEVSYPIKIHDAINQITPLYAEIACEILEKIQNGIELKAIPQVESDSSYSLWRDEDDYRINWDDEANNIQQFVYSVGYPFRGASTFMDKTLIRISDCQVVEDVIIENRQVGKVLFLEDGYPIVVCREGLLKITEATYENGDNVLPLSKLRLRFK